MDAYIRHSVQFDEGRFATESELKKAGDLQQIEWVSSEARSETLARLEC
jgi:hypothetical protein